MFADRHKHVLENEPNLWKGKVEASVVFLPGDLKIAVLFPYVLLLLHSQECSLPALEYLNPLPRERKQQFIRIQGF